MAAYLRCCGSHINEMVVRAPPSFPTHHRRKLLPRPPLLLNQLVPRQGQRLAQNRARLPVDEARLGQGALLGVEDGQLTVKPQPRDGFILQPLAARDALGQAATFGALGVVQKGVEVPPRSALNLLNRRRAPTNV
jgi:hypothetical protein